MALSSTANYIQSGGQSLIFAATSTGPGNFVPIHPNIRNMTVQATMTGSSVAAPVAGSVSIQASNDGVNPIASTLGVINFNQAASPANDGFSIDTHYNYIRAVLAGNTTGSTLSSGSSMQVTVSPLAPRS